MSFENMTLDELERWAILAAVKRFDDNLLKVSKHLKIGRTTLYRKLDRYDYVRPHKTCETEHRGTGAKCELKRHHRGPHWISCIRLSWYTLKSEVP